MDRKGEGCDYMVAGERVGKKQTNKAQSSK